MALRSRPRAPFVAATTLGSTMAARAGLYAHSLRLLSWVYGASGSGEQVSAFWPADWPDFAGAVRLCPSRGILSGLVAGAKGSILFCLRRHSLLSQDDGSRTVFGSE